MMEFWIIRHKPTGGWLPEVHKGYTFSEPQDYGVPRLFGNAAAAKRALTWWLKGTLHVTTYQSNNPETWMEVEQDWHEQEMPERKLEDMEVIPVLLKL